MARTVRRPDTPTPREPKPVRRLRPFIAGTVAADIGEALRAEHARTGGAFAHTVERVLRRGLGLDPSASPIANP